ncbi:hypothetical protein IIA16_03460 [bacterium]|nr:hypothetical protein [bacterium]
MSQTSPPRAPQSPSTPTAPARRAHSFRAPPPTGPLANSAPLLFGKDASGGSKFGGTLAQVLIFNRALSPQEAATLHQEGKQPLCP